MILQLDGTWLCSLCSEIVSVDGVFLRSHCCWYDHSQYFWMYDAIKVKPEYLLLSYSWILIETGFTLKMMKDDYNDLLQCLMLYLALP